MGNQQTKKVLYKKGIPDCFNKILNKYSNKFNIPYSLCQKTYDECVSSCLNEKEQEKKLKCIKECKIIYNCENIYNDIIFLIDVINKIDEKDKSMDENHIVQVDKIISNNLTSIDKNFIRKTYTENLNCKDAYNPCSFNSKLLLHFILFIILNRVNLNYNLNYNIINTDEEKKIFQNELDNCHKSIGIPVDNEKYIFSEYDDDTPTSHHKTDIDTNKDDRIV